MKQIVSLSILLLIIKCSSAQDEVNSFQLSAGKSWHGTGDFGGLSVDVIYEHASSKRLSFSYGLTTTIHYGKDKGFNSLFPGISPDENLMRFTTAGIQSNALLNFAFLSLHDDKVRLSGGAFIRFESTSYPVVYGYHQVQGQSQEPSYTIYNHSNHNRIGVGYSLGLSYITKLTTKYQAGVKAFFQNDTNSSTITGVSLILGRLLPRLK